MTIQHYDALGRPLVLGDCVVYPHGNILNFGVITKINPKLIGVTRIGDKGWCININIYPTELLKIEGPEVTIMLLKCGHTT
jgi:hypothetical protein